MLFCQPYSPSPPRQLRYHTLDALPTWSFWEFLACAQVYSKSRDYTVFYSSPPFSIQWKKIAFCEILARFLIAGLSLLLSIDSRERVNKDENSFQCANMNFQDSCLFLDSDGWHQGPDTLRTRLEGRSPQICTAHKK